MGVLEKVQEMKSLFTEIEAELQAAPAPVEDLQPKIDALVKERDALRAAINAEIEDKKTDTKRLEAAVAPVVEAEVPVVEAPAPTEEPAPAPNAEVTAAE